MTMKKQLSIALVALSCSISSIDIAQAIELFDSQAHKFTPAMVSGKTMVSSGYANGTMTFNSNGSLTCINYPAVISCKSWQIQPDGRLLREFTDNHTGATVEVRAYWQLLNQSGNTLQVNQTSNNADGSINVTVIVQ